MDATQQKVAQYLSEAHASERALIRVLQSQIAMTPRGAYRTALETHLDETRSHADRVGARLREVGEGTGVLAGARRAATGITELAVGQALALGKAPIDMLRGDGGDEKVLKNAKDACATEALEIATYLALERVATEAGDKKTAKLAASIRADEERMLDRIQRAIPALAGRVADAAAGHPAYDVATTGAGETVRDISDTTRRKARSGTKTAKRAARNGAGTAKDAAREGSDAARGAARQSRRVPGVTTAEGRAKGAVASEGDLPIARYDSLTAEEIIGRLREMSQVDLAKIDTYERRHEDRATITSRIDSLRGDQPWAGYDEMTAAEVQSALSDADDDVAKEVAAYERAHKERASVIAATERARSTA